MNYCVLPLFTVCRVRLNHMSSGDAQEAIATTWYAELGWTSYTA